MIIERKNKNAPVNHENKNILDNLKIKNTPYHWKITKCYTSLYTQVKAAHIKIYIFSHISVPIVRLCSTPAL